MTHAEKPSSPWLEDEGSWPDGALSEANVVIGGDEGLEVENGVGVGDAE